MVDKEQQGDFIGHTFCPKCGSGDNVSVHVKEKDGKKYYDGHCWTPGCKPFWSQKELEEHGMIQPLLDGKGNPKYAAPKKSPMTVDEFNELKSRVVSPKELVQSGFTYRGVRAEILNMFGHLVEFKDGQPYRIYYPETNPELCTDPSLKTLVGYKTRTLPKKFGAGNIGLVGKRNELSGQFRFRNIRGKYILIVGGELDQVSAYQMLMDCRRQDGYEPIPVVSPTIGESGAADQIKAQYDFLDQFDTIVIGMDSDKAGREAAKKICQVLPKDKVKIANWTYKDPNIMLQKGMQKQFVADFFNAEDYEEGAIKDSVDALDGIREFLTAPRITLPPYMHRLQENMRGGIRSTGAIVNIIAHTSTGKCLGKDTPVLMADGSVKMVQDVVEGDYLMGDDGSPRKVLSTVKGYDRLYKVRQVKGMDYIVNSAHILSLRAGKNINQFEIREGDVVNINVESYIRKSSDFREYLKGYIAEFHRSEEGKYEVVRYINTEIEVEDRGYGEYYGFSIDGNRLFCLGDGTVTHNTLVTDNMMYHWLFHSPLTPTVVSLERTAEELMIDFVSMRLKKNLTFYADGKEAWEIITSEEGIQAQKEISVNEDGKRRFYIIDERDGDIYTLQRQMERSAKKYGSKMFIIDPLTDLLRSLGNEAQEEFMKWQKYMKKEGYVFINVLHTRKPGVDSEGNAKFVTEYDALGSGTFVQSADINIVLNRNKNDPDPVKRNLMYVDMPKCRGGVTGPAAKWYFDIERREQVDYEDWLQSQPDTSWQEDDSEPVFDSTDSGERVIQEKKETF